MEVVQRENDEPSEPWRPGDPFPERARERCLSWMEDVAKAEGKVVVGRIDGDALT